MSSKRILTWAMALSLLASLTSAGGAAAGRRAHSPSVWLTTGDRTHLLERQPRGALGPPDASLPTITVDPSTRYQRIAGFGASITDSSAAPLAPSPHRNAIMRDLFDPRRGLGLSYLRQPMGASDFVAGPHYTYDDQVHPEDWPPGLLVRAPGRGRRDLQAATLRPVPSAVRRYIPPGRLFLTRTGNARCQAE